MPSVAWQVAASAKRDELFAQVPLDWKLDEYVVQSSQSPWKTIASVLSAGELDITERPAHELLHALRNGDLTASEVAFAFCHRAVLAHQMVRVTLFDLGELDLPGAITRARELDEFWNTHHSPIGPLHGLPISLMDRFHVAGLDTACGFASWTQAKKSATDEGALVKTLRELGAVLFCKTNVPMSMMAGRQNCERIDPADYGFTDGPFNPDLSAGGACGGEGALLALKGSPLGIGTDVAGSSRIPSAFNGLWSLKSSEGRLPYSGVATVLRGLPISVGTIGLMSSSPDGLLEVFQNLLSAKPWLSDSNVLELPWRQEKLDAIRKRKSQADRLPGRLVFGVMASDGHVQPHPTVDRAILEVTQALQHSGYETVIWDPPPHAAAVETLFRIFGSTAAAEARLALNQSGEPPWYDNGDVEPSTSAEFWELCDKQQQYQAQYASYWRSFTKRTRSARIPDGVILPATPHTASRHGDFHYFGYSAIANVLDYPAATFPVTVGDSELDQVTKSLSWLSDVDARVQQTFDPQDVHGMPVGLQVMCPRLQEEQVLGLVEAISDALNRFKRFAGTY
ncbi:Acetamidase [Pseudocercospora fuligena]|uniref:Acetamidase n=1 Tax=Pseudocercospora fuligena TaxID=685502 RepID=A0A8H6RDL9_9PEZI|nr:Acetamidase [Pseudocercospora fuligena]